MIRGFVFGVAISTTLIGCGDQRANVDQSTEPLYIDAFNERSLTELKPSSMGFGGPGNGPGSFTPFKPVQPDKLVDRAYSLNGASISVVGVCSLSNDALSCWTPDGKPDPQLTQQTMVRYKEGGDLSNQHFFTQVAKKNRLILYKVKNPPSKFSTRIVEIRDPESTYALSNSQLANALPSTPSDKPVSRAIARDSSEKKCTLLASIVEPISNSKDLKCEVGSQIAYEGAELRIEAITKGKIGWTIELKVTGDKGPERLLEATALDKNGKAITRSDRNGQPVSEADADAELSRFRQQLENNPSLATQGPVFRSAKPSIKSQTKNGITISTSVDPKYVDRIYFSGVRLWKIEIAGIPLDPIKK